MKKLLLSIFLVLPFIAPISKATTPPAVAPITAIIVGPAFAEGGGPMGDFGVVLRADKTGFARDISTGIDQDIVWLTYSRHGQSFDPKGDDYLAIFAPGWTFSGKIHGGPDGRRFVFGKWECNLSGSRGHVLFEVTYLSC